MSKSIETFYNNYDRITDKKRYREIISFIHQNFGVCFNAKDIYSLFTSYEYERLPQDVQEKILNYFKEINVSFRNYILNFTKTIIEYKNSDNRLIDFELEENKNRGIINVEKTNYSSSSDTISISTIMGDFKIISAIDYLSKKVSVIEYIKRNRTFGMCFTNSIQLLENFQNGRIIFMQLDSEVDKFLHAVFVDESNNVIDLNYLAVLSYEDFIKLYNPNILKEIDYENWQLIKHNSNYQKAESLLVSYCLFNSSKVSTDNDYSYDDLIKYLDNFSNFESKNIKR